MIQKMLSDDADTIVLTTRFPQLARDMSFYNYHKYNGKLKDRASERSNVHMADFEKFENER